MTYLYLTVAGKLRKLSDDYCPDGLQSPTPTTISNIETAADVNDDHILSLDEFEGMPDIVAKYCKMMAEANGRANGSAKSGKGGKKGEGAKRKRMHNKNQQNGVYTMRLYFYQIGIGRGC